VHLAADYGPKRSNSDRLAGSCLTISRLERIKERNPIYSMVSP
jgi:hypothetical protein